MMCVRTYVRVRHALRNVEVTSRWNVAVSRLRIAGLGIRNVTCTYVCIYGAELAVGARSEIEKRFALRIWDGAG